MDVEAHTAALQGGGSTVIVLAEGIQRFKLRRGALGDVWDWRRALVVSQFAPMRPWSVSNAMRRNGVIVGLSDALVVVEAGTTGGTLAAGLTALEAGRPVYALASNDSPQGNFQLIRKGAIAVRSASEMARLLRILNNQPRDDTLL